MMLLTCQTAFFFFLKKTLPFPSHCKESEASENEMGEGKKISQGQQKRRKAQGDPQEPGNDWTGTESALHSSAKQPPIVCPWSRDP